MKRIKYISHYGCKDPERYRFNSPASDSKKDYYFYALNQCGYAVDHISRAACSVVGAHSGSYVEKRGLNTFRYFASWCFSENRYVQYLNRLLVHIQWFLWLVFHLDKGEQLMIYHSLGYDSSFIFLKKIKKLQIIGDIEELYQDVHRVSRKESKNEYRFIDICDKFIFPNNSLNRLLNKESRPHVIVHGIYKVNKTGVALLADDEIHLLYSGTFDMVKGGAIAAIRSMEFLPVNYHLHITGFGSKSQEQTLLEEVRRISNKTKASLEYHGYLSEDDLICLMQRCSIGLCTQNPTHKLNISSFPSKILNYISNGLVVLSGRNSIIEESAVGDIVFYYDEQDPRTIASAIMQIQKPDATIGIRRLNQLNDQFVEELKILIES